MEIAAEVVRRVHGSQRWLQSSPRKTAYRLRIQSGSVPISSANRKLAITNRAGRGEYSIARLPSYSTEPEQVPINATILRPAPINRFRPPTARREEMMPIQLAVLHYLQSVFTALEFSGVCIYASYFFFLAARSFVSYGNCRIYACCAPGRDVARDYPNGAEHGPDSDNWLYRPSS